MGRTAKPWFRKHDGWWYATITPGAKPEKLALGLDAEREAIKRFEELKRTSQRPYDLLPAEDLVSEFLQHIDECRKPRTYESYVDLLSGFCKVLRQSQGC